MVYPRFPWTVSGSIRSNAGRIGLRLGILAAILCIGLPLRTTAQRVANEIAWADSVFKSQENQKISDPARSLPVLNKVLRILLAEGDTCRAARVESWRSHCFDAIGMLDSAVVVAQQGLKWFSPDCDSLILMSLHVNESNALISLGDHQGVLRICESSLEHWNDRWPYSIARNGLMTNRAIAMVNLGDSEGAMQVFRDLLRLAREERKTQSELDALQNIGALFGFMGAFGSNTSQLDSSEAYMRQTLVLSKQLGDKDGTLNLYANLAIVNKDRKRYATALPYLDSAFVLATGLGSLEFLVNIANTRSECLFGLGFADSAYTSLRTHLALKDSLLNTEKMKAIADVQEKYESEKKAHQISELEVDKLDSELRQAQLKRTRNIYLFGGLAVMATAAGLWSRLRLVHRSRAAIQKEKDRSEELLLNILPEEVAKELKAKGSAEAVQIDQVTVLFTDFKGFTAMSEVLSPRDLVRDLNECFSAFDHITEKYGIEKIKTIGDAYMAAGGLPTPNTTHAVDVINAALEMRDFIAEGKAQKIAAGLPYFEIRIGVHTGPVVAGIVGVKKFQYDIWGDTVNTASRMESSGEVGQVNISEATYALVREVREGVEVPAFGFTPRGKVQAKGKGEMEMYFAWRSSDGAGDLGSHPTNDDRG